MCIIQFYKTSDLHNHLFSVLMLVKINRQSDVTIAFNSDFPVF